MTMPAEKRFGSQAYNISTFSRLEKCNCSTFPHCWEAANKARNDRKASWTRPGDVDPDANAIAQWLGPLFETYPSCPAILGQLLVLWRSQSEKSTIFYNTFLANGGRPDNTILDSRMRTHLIARSYEKALDVIKDFHRFGVRMDSRNTAAAISACGRLNDVARARAIFDAIWNDATAEKVDIICCTEMLSVYHRDGDLDSVRTFFDEVHERLEINETFWNMALATYRDAYRSWSTKQFDAASSTTHRSDMERHTDGVLHIYSIIETATSKSTAPDAIQMPAKTLDIVLTILWLAGRTREADAILEQHLMNSTCSLDVLLCNHTILRHCDSRDPDKAISLRTTFRTKDISLATEEQLCTILRSLLDAKRLDDAFTLLMNEWLSECQPCDSSCQLCLEAFNAASRFDLLQATIESIKLNGSKRAQRSLASEYGTALHDDSRNQWALQEIVRHIADETIDATTLRMLFQYWKASSEVSASDIHVAFNDLLASNRIDQSCNSLSLTQYEIQAFGQLMSASGVYIAFNAYNLKHRGKVPEDMNKVTQTALRRIVRLGGRAEIVELANVIRDAKNINFARCLSRAAVSGHTTDDSCWKLNVIIDAIAARLGASTSSSMRVDEHFVKTLATYASQSQLIHTQRHRFEGICFKALHTMLSLKSIRTKKFLLARFFSGAGATIREVICQSYYDKVVASVAPLREGSAVDAAKRVSEAPEIIRELVSILHSPSHGFVLAPLAGERDCCGLSYLRTSLADMLHAQANYLSQGMPPIRLEINLRALMAEQRSVTLSYCLTVLNRCHAALDCKKWPLMAGTQLATGILIRISVTREQLNFQYEFDTDVNQCRNIAEQLQSPPEHRIECESDAVRIANVPYSDSYKVIHFGLRLNLYNDDLSSEMELPAASSREIPGEITDLVRVCTREQLCFLQRGGQGKELAKRVNREAEFYERLDECLSCIDSRWLCSDNLAIKAWGNAYRIRVEQGAAQTLYWLSRSEPADAIQAIVHELKNFVANLSREKKEVTDNAIMWIRLIREKTDRLQNELQFIVKKTYHNELVSVTTVNDTLLRAARGFEDRINYVDIPEMPAAASNPLFLEHALRAIIENGVRECARCGPHAQLTVTATCDSEKHLYILLLTNPRVRVGEVVHAESETASGRTGLGLTNAKALLARIGSRLEDFERDSHFEARIDIPYYDAEQSQSSPMRPE